jgi:AAA15 family ATPase/GTPase
MQKTNKYTTNRRKKFPIDTLSSGEKEVVNIVFDFILRNASDCIVMFDEPELHLHPELSYKLLQTLSSIGKKQPVPVLYTLARDNYSIHRKFCNIYYTKEA